MGVIQRLEPFEMMLGLDNPAEAFVILRVSDDPSFHLIHFMATPFFVFWFLLFLARDVLGVKGIAVFVLVWGAMLFGAMRLAISPYFFISAQALLDAVIFIIAFKRDIRIR